MSKMSELSMMLDDLIACGTKLAKTARALKEFYSSDEQEQPAPDKKTYGKKASKKQESPAQTHRIRHHSQNLQKNIPRKMSAGSLPQKQTRQRASTKPRSRHWSRNTETAAALPM